MRKPLVIHPFLFAIFPILFLFSHNIDQMSISQTWPSLLISSAIALVSMLLLGLILRNWRKAGIIVSTFLILFFSYGHVYSLLWDEQRDNPIPGGHGVLLAVWVLLLLGVVIFVVRTSRSLQDLTRYLNAVASALVVLSLVNTGVYEFAKLGRTDIASAESTAAVLAESERAETLPDIYYIILDGYARSDILQEIYGYDNSEFLEFLTQRGFFVASESRANYVQTLLSLTSALNLDYLDDLASRMGADSRDRAPLGDLLRDNTVFRLLREKGYVIAAFSSGYGATEFEEADLYLSPGWSWDEFEIALMNTTPLQLVLDEQVEYSPYELHRRRILYTLEHLEDVPRQKAPRFVFAHIIAPHPPFVFGEHGEEITPDREFLVADGSHYMETGTREEYIKQYRDQLVFITDQIEKALDRILAKASRPSIIILQSDHGPGSLLDWEVPENTYFKERLAILNAYYLPDHNFTGLYDGISPVNTFRVIFREYFGAEYELLPDESYYSRWKQLYDFLDVTDEITGP